MRLTLLSLAVVLTFTAAGCRNSRNSPEALLKEEIEVLNEYSAVLESIKSKEDVQKNRPRLEALKNKLEDIEARTHKLLETRTEEWFRAAEKHGEALGQAESRFDGAIEKAVKAVGSLKGLIPDDLSEDDGSPVEIP